MYPTYLGLASASSMAKLTAATNNEVDGLFISLMITHHDGAIQGFGVSSGLQYGKLIEFRNKSFADYESDIKELKEL